MIITNKPNLHCPNCSNKLRWWHATKMQDDESIVVVHRDCRLTAARCKYVRNVVLAIVLGLASAGAAVMFGHLASK